MRRQPVRSVGWIAAQVRAAHPPPPGGHDGLLDRVLERCRAHEVDDALLREVAAAARTLGAKALSTVVLHVAFAHRAGSHVPALPLALDAAAQEFMTSSAPRRCRAGAAEVEERLPSLVLAYAALRHDHPQLFSSAVTSVTARLPKISLRHVAYTLWACAVSRHAAPALRDALAARAAADRAAFTEQARGAHFLTLNQLVCAFVVAEHHAPVLFDVVAEALGAKLDDPDGTRIAPSAASSAAWAYAAAGHPAPLVFSGASQLASARTADFSAGEAARLVWALARARHCVHDGFAAAVRQAAAVPGLAPELQQGVVWACAEARHALPAACAGGDGPAASMPSAAAVAPPLKATAAPPRVQAQAGRRAHKKRQRKTEERADTQAEEQEKVGTLALRMEAAEDLKRRGRRGAPDAKQRAGRQVHEQLQCKAEERVGHMHKHMGGGTRRQKQVERLARQKAAAEGAREKAAELERQRAAEVLKRRERRAALDELAQRKAEDPERWQGLTDYARRKAEAAERQWAWGKPEREKQKELARRRAEDEDVRAGIEKLRAVQEELKQERMEELARRRERRAALQELARRKAEREVAQGGAEAIEGGAVALSPQHGRRQPRPGTLGGQWGEDLVQRDHGGHIGVTDAQCAQKLRDYARERPAGHVGLRNHHVRHITGLWYELQGSGARVGPQALAVVMEYLTRSKVPARGVELFDEATAGWGVAPTTDCYAALAEAYAAMGAFDEVVRVGEAVLVAVGPAAQPPTRRQRRFLYGFAMAMLDALRLGGRPRVEAEPLALDVLNDVRAWGGGDPRNAAVYHRTIKVCATVETGLAVAELWRGDCGAAVWDEDVVATLLHLAVDLAAWDDAAALVAQHVLPPGSGEARAATSALQLAALRYFVHTGEIEAFAAVSGRVERMTAAVYTLFIRCCGTAARGDAAYVRHAETAFEQCMLDHTLEHQPLLPVARALMGVYAERGDVGGMERLLGVMKERYLDSRVVSVQEVLAEGYRTAGRHEDVARIRAAIALRRADAPAVPALPRCIADAASPKA